MLPDFLAPLVMPAEIPVRDIADRAFHEAFETIAEGLADAGYMVTGDYSPNEVEYVQGLFEAFVFSLARNNTEIAALQEDDA